MPDKQHTKPQRKSSKKPANFVSEESELFSDDSCYSVIHTVAHVKINVQPKVQLEFSEEKGAPGIHLACIMDTGTSCNIMSIADLNKLVPNATLKPSQSRLHLYDGSYMKPLGVYSMYARYLDTTQRLRFEIVSTAVARKPLLSSNTCQKMGLISINVPPPSPDATTSAAREIKYANDSGPKQSAHVCVDQNTQGSNILDKYSDVFEGLGCLPGELNLKIDSSVPPVQHTPRKVPISIKSSHFSLE